MLVVGTIVRLIKEPYFGEIGIVYNLPMALEKVETEAKVRILQVKLEDNRIVTVPRANVEMMEI